MCGIIGGWSEKADISSKLKALDEGRDLLESRGPDGSGQWTSNHGVAFGHTRLSVIDPSSAGDQPMTSSSGRFVVTYNGEIYNFRSVKEKLEDQCREFHSSSDTEVLLEAIEEWGLRETLSRINGMFAFAVWDDELKRLHLARDRMGQKPLYFARTKEAFAFASQPNPIAELFENSFNLDLDSISALARYLYIPGPRSVWEEVRKLMPGSVLTVQRDSVGEITLDRKKYWSLSHEVTEAISSRQSQSNPRVISDLKETIGNAVEDRLVADVPVGALLSGGIDSSTIVALMQERSEARVRTFTVGLQQEEFDESSIAREVAGELGTDHSEITVTSDEALEVIEDLPRMYDEPFADRSQIPTYLISRFAQKDVTVALSGDGGDELFGGYERHRRLSLLSRLASIPQHLRDIGSKGIEELSPSLLRGLVKTAEPIIPDRYKISRPGATLHKLSRTLRAEDQKELIDSLISYHPLGPDILREGMSSSLVEGTQIPDLPTLEDQLMFFDTTTYLPGDIHTKVDRASMAVGLEVRAPFMDPRVLRKAWSLHPSLKINNGEGKIALKETLRDFLPKQILDRPKAGFGVPIGEWLRGPLQTWADRLLDQERINEQRIFEPETIQKCWTAHLTGKADWSDFLWAVLMFQLWYDEHAEFRDRAHKRHRSLSEASA